MTHPHQLHALAALWSLRAALEQHLPEHRETVLIQRPQLGPAATRPRTLAQLEQYDTWLRAERADRLSRTGLKPIGQDAPAPLPLGLLDLERQTLDALAESVQLLTLAHWSRRPLLGPGVWIVAHQGRLPGLWAYAAAALEVTAPDLAAGVEDILTEADENLRSVCGLGPDLWALPLSPPCPTCRERLLRVQTSAPDSDRWTIVCTNAGCRCLGDGQQGAGDGCPCGMPTRAQGVRHIWTADSPLAVSAFAGAALANTTNRREAA